MLNESLSRTFALLLSFLVGVASISAQALDTLQNATVAGTSVSKLNSIDTGAQINPGIAALPNNRFVMVYEGRAGNDGSVSGIFGGIYDAEMRLTHDCGVVNTTTNS